MKISIMTLIQVLLVIPTVLAQKDPIPISTSYVIPRMGDEVLVELKSALMDEPYKGFETFELYGPNDVLLTKYDVAICSFGECSQSTDEPVENTIVYPDGQLNGESVRSIVVVPLGLTFKKYIPPGKYTIVVRNRDGKKVIHRRVLTLVSPEPSIRGFIATYPDGSVTNGKLKIDPNKDLKNVKIRFEGEHLNEEFKSVSIQGLRLEKDTETNTYKTGNDWIPEKLRTISLEEPKVVFERENVLSPYSYGLVLEAQKPQINGNLVYKVNAGENRFLLQLSVSNLFPRAQIKLSEVNGRDVLAVEGTLDGAKVEVENGTISQYIQFNSGVLSSGSAEFSVQVINRDGHFSEPRTVHIQVQESTVTVAPSSASKPFIEELPNLVRFTRSDHAHTFRFVGDVILKLNDSFSVIQPQNMDASFNQFAAEVVLPKGTGPNAPFEISNNGHVWRGFFIGTVPKPELQEELREVFVGSSVMIHLKTPSDQVKAITRFEDSRIKQTDNDFTDGAIEITVDADVPVNTHFTTSLYYRDHTIETIDFRVVGWPDPEKTVEVKIEDSVYFLGHQKVVLPDHQVMVLQSKSNQSRNFTSKLTAQLINSDGTKLGTPQSFLYQKGTGKFSTTLTPYLYGLSGGNEFMVELVYPSGQPVLQRAYVKRELKDRFKFNVGVSAVNIYLKKRKDEQGEEISKASLISGVNIGSYYLFEWIKSEGKRPLGIGANLMAQENNDEVNVRLGMSALVYETISLGLNFGNDGAAIFLGASVDFVDLSKMFGGAD